MFILEICCFAIVLDFGPLSSPDSMLTFSRGVAVAAGALGAVFAWDRIAAAVCAILRRWFYVPVIRYVDDIFFIIDADCAAFVRELVIEIVTLCGLVLDPDKTPFASSSAILLGVQVDVTPRSLTLRVYAAKLTFWLRLLRALAGEVFQSRPPGGGGGERFWLAPLKPCP